MLPSDHSVTFLVILLRFFCNDVLRCLQKLERELSCALSPNIRKTDSSYSCAHEIYNTRGAQATSCPILFHHWQWPFSHRHALETAYSRGARAIENKYSQKPAYLVVVMACVDQSTANHEQSRKERKDSRHPCAFVQVKAELYDVYGSVDTQSPPYALMEELRFKDIHNRAPCLRSSIYGD